MEKIFSMIKKCWFDYLLAVMIWLIFVLQAFNGIKITVISSTSLFDILILLILSLYGLLNIIHNAKCIKTSSS